MTQREKNYYEVLGVPRNATESDIKSRYRQLVRRHHPDVAEDKEASKAAFILIAEAYQTLINPDRRLLYDTSMDTPKFRPQQPARPAGPKPTESQRPSGTAAKSAQSRPASDTRGTTATSGRTRPSEVQRLLKDARKAYGAGQFYLALDACREVRRLDPRNAEAYIIPGDVYRLQGRIDEAISSYTVAVQLDPKNVDVQNKLDRLFRQSKYSVPDADEIKNRNASLRLGLNMIVLAIIGGLFLWLNVEPGEPSVWLRDHVEFVSAWNMKFIWIMALASVLVGVLLSVNNAVRDLDDELIFPSVRASGIKKVSYPLGLILLVLSFFSFYAAGLVYVLIGWLQESVSISILRVFASVLGLVALGAMAFGQGAGQVLLFGGNLAFVGILVGWGIGDLFRPAW